MLRSGEKILLQRLHLETQMSLSALVGLQSVKLCRGSSLQTCYQSVIQRLKLLSILTCFGIVFNFSESRCVIWPKQRFGQNLNTSCCPPVRYCCYTLPPVHNAGSGSGRGAGLPPQARRGGHSDVFSWQIHRWDTGYCKHDVWIDGSTWIHFTWISFSFG